MIKTDILIIGAGPGGYVAAIRLGQMGKKVLLVDRDRLGGECLNYGCIPSKALIWASSLVHKFRKAQEIGITAQNIQVDLAKLQAWKSGLLQGMNRGILNLLKGNGVEFLQGEARFTSSNTAEVAHSETIEFGRALIATGSRPIELSNFAFDGARILSSKEALDLKSIPPRLLVVGGGVIGLEIGTFYAKLGSQVTVVELLGQILPGIEPDLTQPVARALQKLGVQVHLESKVLDCLFKDGTLSVRVQTPQAEKEILTDAVLVSVGRVPNSSGLGLESAGVEVDPKGFVKVDGRYRTSRPDIYAMGDVIGPPFLAHKGSHEGLFVASLLSGEEPESLGAIPWAIFTDPEIACVGISETQAREKGNEIQVGRFPFSASGRAQTTREGEGFVKVISEKGNGRILGVGIVGSEASDLISEACLALKMRATVHDLASTIHPHPTLPEALMEAAEVSAGSPIHVLPKKASGSAGL